MDGYWPADGFLHNDDNLFYNTEFDHLPDNCPDCGGSGEVRVHVRDPDDRPDIRTVKHCKTCCGKGIVEKRG